MKWVYFIDFIENKIFITANASPKSVSTLTVGVTYRILNHEIADLNNGKALHGHEKVYLLVLLNNKFFKAKIIFNGQLAHVFACNAKSAQIFFSNKNP